jgi:hypothetical protein
MPSTLLLCACTKKKRKPTTGELQFRALPHCLAEDLARVWFAKTVAISEEETLPARALYAGPGWSAALSSLRLAATPGESKPELFVLSAGFGLIHANDSIPSYEASFSASLDRVADHIIDSEGKSFKNPDLAHREWWRAINKARGKSATPCTNLIPEYPNAPIVVAAGRDYIAAMHDDLIALARAVGPERLFIVSVGYPWQNADEALRRCAIPLTIDVERLLLGARSFINTQLLSWLLTHAGPVTTWDRALIQQLIEERLKASPSKPQRRPFSAPKMKDTEVGLWIREKLSEDPKPSRTTLLWQLRNEAHRSCSQERFASIYKKEIDTVVQNKGEAVRMP